MCKCTFAQRMVGDGCEECNPELSRFYIEERIETLRSEINTLLKDLAEAKKDLETWKEKHQK